MKSVLGIWCLGIVIVLVFIVIREVIFERFDILYLDVE